MEGAGALYRGKNHFFQTKELRSADSDAVKLIATAHSGYRVTEEFRISRVARPPYAAKPHGCQQILTGHGPRHHETQRGSEGTPWGWTGRPRCRPREARKAQGWAGHTPDTWPQATNQNDARSAMLMPRCQHTTRATDGGA